jgi:hypothetical protein
MRRALKALVTAEPASSGAVVGNKIAEREGIRRRSVRGSMRGSTGGTNGSCLLPSISRGTE